MSWMEHLPKEHAMTGDEYLAKRCLDLERENQELKEQIEKIKYNKSIQFVLDFRTVKGKFQFEYDEKEAKIKHIECDPIIDNIEEKEIIKYIKTQIRKGYPCSDIGGTQHLKVDFIGEDNYEKLMKWAKGEQNGSSKD